MCRTIVVAFSTVDGVVEDPDGTDGSTSGGWAFRHGREAVAGDKFKLGAVLDCGVLLFGHKTWGSSPASGRAGPTTSRPP